jgi:hypothetical protein
MRTVLDGKMAKEQVLQRRRGPLQQQCWGEEMRADVEARQVRQSLPSFPAQSFFELVEELAVGNPAQVEVREPQA